MQFRSTSALNLGQLWTRLFTFAVVVGVHVSLLLALQSRTTARPEATAPVPLIVDLIEPAPNEAAQQAERSRPAKMPAPPKPQLQRDAKPHPKPDQPPAVVEAASETLAKPYEPAALASAAPVTMAPELAAAEPQPVQSAEPEPAATTVPRFDAAYLNNPPPVYPRRSRRAGETGKVVLRVLVTPDGSAGEVRLRDSSGFELLDEAAIAAVRQWRFVAARQGDTKVAAWVVVPLRFDLDR